MSDLLEFVEWPAVEALNAKPDKGVGNALKQVGYHSAALSCCRGQIMRDRETRNCYLADNAFTHATASYCRAIARTTRWCWRATRTSSS